MKKIIVLLMVLLTMCSSVFAKDKTTEDEKSKLTTREKLLYADTLLMMIDSKLDLKRWELIDASVSEGYCILLDKETIAAPYSDTLEYWTCTFWQAGKGSCSDPVCKEKKINRAKHYHYARLRCGLRHLTIKPLALVRRDESMNVIDSLDVPLYLQKEKAVFPGSLGEREMLKAKEIASQKKKKR